MQAAVQQCLEHTVSADKAVRKQAEEQLRHAEGDAGFSLILLAITADNSAALGARQAGAVYFKNLVKQRWTDDERPLPPADKEAVKAGLLGLMVSVPELVQRQLSEAISTISTSDFPEQWPSLLPELVNKLGTAASAREWGLVNGLLLTCTAMFRPYRHEFKSDALFTKIKYVLAHLQEPLLQLAKGMGQQLEATSLTSPADARGAGVLLTCLETATEVHISLASQELPEYFEDHMGEWMGVFQRLLSFQPSGGLAGDADDAPGPLEHCQAAVVECLSLYISKYDEEFAEYLPAFVQVVWQRLIAVGTGARYDPLATMSIKFLTSVASSVHHQLYAQGSALQDVCEHIVVPNMRLLEADEEMFEDDPAEYIRRDIEGSDADTRRRVCAELVRALCRNFGERVGQIFNHYTAAMLQQHAADPQAQWKAKDVAIYLVTALSIKAGSGALGATQTSGLVDISSFFEQAILPELRAGAERGGQGADALPVLKADAIKFVSTFRAQLSPAALKAVLPLLPSLLQSRHAVVHTYAAHALERLLTTRAVASAAAAGAAGAAGAAAGSAAANAAAGGGGARVLQPADVADLLQPLLGGLLSILKRPASAESEYAMRAIMRLVTFTGGAQLAPVVGGVLDELKSILARVCANPSAPTFNHYLFEAVAALVKETCAAQPSAVEAFEAALFPPFQQVLQLDVAEFAPYVFQIFAQLLEARAAALAALGSSASAPALSAAYRELWPPLLLPAMWEQRANVPALARLVRAYVRTRDAAVLGSLPSVLGIFQKLVASKATEVDGCQLLGSVFDACPPAALQQYLGEVCRIALTRWQHNRTRKFALALTAALSTLVGRQEGAAEQLVLAMDALHAGTFAGFFGQVWLEHVGAQQSSGERRSCAMALVRLLGEAPSFKAQPQFALLCPKALDVAIGLLEGGAAAVEEEDDAGGVEGEGVGYTAAYARLHHAGEAAVDPTAGVDVRAALAVGVQRLSAELPGGLMALLTASAGPSLTAHLPSYLQRVGIDPASLL